METGVKACPVKRLVGLFGQSSLTQGQYACERHQRNCARKVHGFPPHSVDRIKMEAVIKTAACLPE
jgi:hypothetical protein